MDSLADLPLSRECERAVLAGVLMDPAAWTVAAGRLGPEDFGVERHRVIWEAFREVADDGSEPDLRTLQALLERRGQLEKVGGLGYLAELDLDLPDLSRLEHYVEVVKDRSIQRQLLLGIRDLEKDLRSGMVPSSDLLARAMSLSSALGQVSDRSGLERLGGAIERTLGSLEDSLDAAPRISTGFSYLDSITHGMSPGALWILAARPGMGKTTLALDIARHVAGKVRRPVAFFSLEMSDEELVQRMLSASSGVPFESVRAGRMSERQWAELYESARQLMGAELWIDDSANLNLLEISAKARRMRAEHGLALVVVDYLQLMEAGGRRHESRQLEISAISRGLKQLAKELEVPVLALSQLSREPERRQGNHRPRLSDLRESGSIEQDADLVAFVYRDELYHPDNPDNRGLAELLIAKHRNGRTGTVELAFLGEITTFRSLERRYAASAGDPF